VFICKNGYEFYNRITRQNSETCIVCFGALLDGSERGIQGLVLEGSICLVNAAFPAPNLVTSSYSDLNNFSGSVCSHGF
jgi:hypothetical protein